MNELIIKGKKAKEVSFILGNLSTGEKNNGLNAMADFLVNNKEEIINANKIDLQAAIEKGTRTGRLHHHVVMSGGLLPRDIAIIWGKGYVNKIQPLQFNEFGITL